VTQRIRSTSSARCSQRVRGAARCDGWMRCWPPRSWWARSYRRRFSVPMVGWPAHYQSRRRHRLQHLGGGRQTTRL